MKTPATSTANNSDATTTDATASDAADFDLRSIPCRIKHAQIFQRWLDLAVGRHFVLLNDHDPVPLHYQFSAEFPGAFGWEYLERGPEEFRVKITKLRAVTGVTPTLPRTAMSATAPVATENRWEIDVRSLEPPEPLIRILDALEKLPPGASLHARTDREPCHLFGEAEQRGFRSECRKQNDGSWITVLTHA